MSVAVKLLVMFLVLANAAIAIFLAVAYSTHHPVREQHDVPQRGYSIRGRWFLVLVLCLIASFAASIPFYPYMSATSALGPARKVPVIAEQYAFIMPSRLPVGKAIIFEVTSRDVNHDFGIYNPQGHLIAQVQAMPDYTNYLRVIFHEPGQYTARCLEYCGIGHAIMAKTFTVGDK
ncbi:MAG: cytochrome c oxidase subunit II [Phycisphaerales bacterium]|nr:cytochrome c oxidase subunit II [Phycisphaerales bacterium]